MVISTYRYKMIRKDVSACHSHISHNSQVTLIRKQNSKKMTSPMPVHHKPN